jgi:hypothetical protein
VEGLSIGNESVIDKQPHVDPSARITNLIFHRFEALTTLRPREPDLSSAPPRLRVKRLSTPVKDLSPKHHVEAGQNELEFGSREFAGTFRQQRFVHGDHL